MEPIIIVKNLSKVYKVGTEKVRALKNIDLTINKGEICCILGTSGSGKSTLLNQLAGLEKPTSGSVFIGKTNISRLTENQLATFRQRNVGFVFQSYNLIASMTAAENVAMPLLFKGTSKSVRNRESALMLKQVGLANRVKHRPSEMSGGQQQRVGIARAFVAKPKIVFADEPTGNLDSHTTLEVMQLLIKMSHEHGITFVLVTHDNELANYADRIITLIDGRIVSDRTNDAPAYIISKEKEHATPSEDSTEEISLKVQDSENSSIKSDNAENNTAIPPTAEIIEETSPTVQDSENSSIKSDNAENNTATPPTAEIIEEASPTVQDGENSSIKSDNAENNTVIPPTAEIIEETSPTVQDGENSSIKSDNAENNTAIPPTAEIAEGETQTIRPENPLLITNKKAPVSTKVSIGEKAKAYLSHFPKLKP